MLYLPVFHLLTATMTGNIDNLILEHLRAVRASIDYDYLAEAPNDLKARLGQVKEHIAGMRRDMSMLQALKNAWMGWKIW